MNISVAPEILFYIGSIPVTNTKTMAVLLTLSLLLFGIYCRRTFKIVPTRIQVVVESAMEFIYIQTKTAFKSKKRAKQLFPVIMSLMIVIFFANQFLLIPLLGQVVLGDTAIFRTLTSDISEPIALALVVLILAHVIAFMVSPLRHIGNFLKFAELFKARTLGGVANALMEVFLGLMDIISEFAKLFSLSFRLFGNVFAGELVILVISSLSFATKFFVPIPFMVLSIFSGLVQALVFTMLAIQFMAGTINAAGDGEETSENDIRSNKGTQGKLETKVVVS